MRKIKLADKAGFCFGVNRAVDTALNCREKYNKPIYTLGPLIHNNDVVKFLKSKDINSIESGDLDSLKENDVIVIRSHGITPKVFDILKEKKIIIADATCPYVAHIHERVRKYYDLGYKIVIVGDSNHPEVIGINGYCNDTAIISKDGLNIRKLPAKVCIVAQTTEKQENFEKVTEKIKPLCDELITFNTICSATKIRQEAASILSQNVDTMVVIGGFHSSNTTKLYEICKKNCKNTVHVENVEQIPKELINSSNNIGVTAGASTPDWIIKEAILKMSEHNNSELNEQLAYMEQNDIQVAIGDTVKGQIISLNEKEAFVNIGYKKDGIIPLKEATRDEDVLMKDLFNVGDEVEAKVISLKNSDDCIVLSKIEIEREEAFKEIENAFNNKSEIIISIKESVNGGIIGRYKGVRVFVPASHVELFHVDDLSTYIGQDMQVKIIEFKVNRKGTKIVASRRELLIKAQAQRQDEAWNSLEKDEVVEGEIRRLTSFGAFVDVNGIDGLLHVSEISWGRVEKPEDVLKIGEKVKVCILDIDKENKKLSLSIKKLTEDPWINIEEKYPIGSIVLGKVVRFADFGAFIQLEPGVDGLVHVSEISYKRINKPSDILKVDEEVKAKILSVNKDGKRLSLSIKEAE
ncbi:bifunctional 4-hydroxy-3-methylbut-2-enyl diphosphate reductase/30S ribosomal protein S1 [Clostridium botulinum]|uniref:bifunctional 4-hydroxy-3-methylbut-2-enyl diphosphate reductase/30S ribosomal protein S1 n=1 Tax=Clostridium botulinum TaxID=1491 RepID=UPI0004D69089|nr:bifunctional 4-hydroxy-3-methylbut-2-enyl diphosphate reductase/30S ribosomal protein S1 [Clostridium botulinum]KEI00400.1 4-hydroxy-3-methylbut-2-enyl diphosphate reductase [Clostridium botulinum C/D str. BKT75002]KEI12658.1 4-hydroxy-3-methylbut-2-enyl diphosphate reductase [Clostridium botulinum C/D str. BKT2873]KGM95219.1 4-hydroxy-3-methylbut-2-enyl diphosphate reductase [Clostridium botulinum D str. CCUG 7971]KOC46078.1 4-hydroxy-3-methylbut-2-enyl diphosphate reductase [Clostridium bo